MFLRIVTFEKQTSMIKINIFQLTRLQAQNQLAEERRLLFFSFFKWLFFKRIEFNADGTLIYIYTLMSPYSSWVTNFKEGEENEKQAESHTQETFRTKKTKEVVKRV